ncbi:citrate lyase acyl carrier protein [Vibrio sp. Y2-5]|uniref:citrate lyase acyl carrier protein n=1 Tax=Vibrio TaxID=662 RepID=UPI00142E50E4|nr:MULTISPECIES: citrate lyase acyl carrier protein [Vibrio]MBD0785401.1 citrate lyase acyl carrier protein [Vibrio sp. Y2-5]NIY92331.1 citrate lyase acyl carrier protein [Vibrio diazotrophicus]
MIISQRSYAGTLESSDLLVEIVPSATNSLDIEITSSVEKQFGELIRNTVISTLSEMGVQSALVKINDKGALDCVIKARVQAAVIRATAANDIVWGTLK